MSKSLKWITLAALLLMVAVAVGFMVWLKQPEDTKPKVTSDDGISKQFKGIMRQVDCKAMGATCNEYNLQLEDGTICSINKDYRDYNGKNVVVEGIKTTKAAQGATPKLCSIKVSNMRTI